MSETNQLRADANDTIRIHPPLLAAILLLGGLLLHLLGPHYRYHVVYLHQFVGMLLVAAGIGLSSYAAALFTARDTTKKPWGQPAAFVVLMPYTFTRNPMYLGMTIALLGFAVFFGSIVMLLAPVIFLVVIDRLVIPREEETMEQLFGQQYLDYKGRVRRWL